MTNEITFDKENGILIDSNGNRVAGDGISCSDGSYIHLDEEQDKDAGKKINAFAEILVDTVGSKSGTVDIGNLESPLKNLCDDTANTVKGK